MRPDVDGSCQLLLPGVGRLTVVCVSDLIDWRVQPCGSVCPAQHIQLVRVGAEVPVHRGPVGNPLPSLCRCCLNGRVAAALHATTSLMLHNNMCVWGCAVVTVGRHRSCAPCRYVTDVKPIAYLFNASSTASGYVALYNGAPLVVFRSTQTLQVRVWHITGWGGGVGGSCEQWV